MEQETSATCRYFCHMCSLIVRLEVGIAEVKCPHCHSGFVEEMAGAGAAADGGGRSGNAIGGSGADEGDAASERAVSLWAPMVMELLGSSSRRNGLDEGDGGGDLAAFTRRQYRNLAFLQLLSALEERDAGGRAPDSAGRERLVLVRPGDAHAMLGGGDGNGAAAAGAGGLTLGDLFLGPGLDLLLEYLAETDPSRNGTPPAKKDAVAALPTVTMREAATCPVCLDEFAAGDEAREMPCKHAFHDGCIVPWLDAHSSCPVCRYQLPTDEPTGANGNVAEEQGGGEPSGRARGSGGVDGGSNGRRPRWLTWPFGGLFSHRSNGNSSSS